MTLFEVPPDDEPLFEEELPPDPVSPAQSRAARDGKEYDQDAFDFLTKAGARVIERYPRVMGYRLDALVEGANGARFLVAAHGTPDTADAPQAGLRRQDTMLKAGFRALRLRDRGCETPVLLLTSHLPRPDTASAYVLLEIADAIWDAVATTGDLDGFHRLWAYFNDTPPPRAPLPAPWRAAQLSFDGVIDLEDD